MYCRSCWRNIPDGSTQCPKCEADLTAPPTASVPAAARVRAQRPAAKKPNRLNVLVGLMAVVVLLLIAGPTAGRWVMQRWQGTPPPEVVGTAAMRPVAQVEPVHEPAAPSEAGGPGAEATRQALALFRDGRIAEACDRFRDAERMAGSEETRRNLGSCLARLGWDAYQRGQAAQAAELYTRSLEAYPNSAAVWRALAGAYVKAGDLDRAQRVLEQAAAGFPGEPELLYTLAEIQERQGRTSEAAETLRRLLAAQPGHERGKSLLASLEREQKVEGYYWKEETRHFVVRYEGARGIDVGRSVADTLEEAYGALGRDLGVTPADRIQVGIYAQDVFGNVVGAPPHLIAGAYDGRKIRLNLAASVANTYGLSRLVRHEYAHALIHQASNGQAPIWVHEGLAQVLEPRSAPRSLPVSVPREYLTLSGIERLSRTGDAEALVAGYSLTHVAVDYLVERGGLGKVREFLGRLGQGEAIDPALRQTFGFGFEEVEQRLLAVAGRG